MSFEVGIGCVSVEIGLEGFEFVVQVWGHQTKFVSVVVSAAVNC